MPKSNFLSRYTRRPLLVSSFSISLVLSPAVSTFFLVFCIAKYWKYVIRKAERLNTKSLDDYQYSPKYCNFFRRLCLKKNLPFYACGTSKCDNLDCCSRVIKHPKNYHVLVMLSKNIYIGKIGLFTQTPTKYHHVPYAFRTIVNESRKPINHLRR